MSTVIHFPIDPNELAMGGETVLHWACQTKVQNKEEVLQFLFDLVKWVQHTLYEMYIEIYKSLQSRKYNFFHF